MTIGRAKFLFERWRNWLGIVSLFLAIRMNIILSPISWWWFVAGFILSLIVLYLDMKFVASEELGMGLSKNHEWQKMIKLLNEIKEKS
jgi:hypothetical protein